MREAQVEKAGAASVIFGSACDGVEISEQRESEIDISAGKRIGNKESGQ